MLFLSLSGRFCCRFRATGGQEARRSAVAGSEAGLTQVNILLTHPASSWSRAGVGGRLARLEKRFCAMAALRFLIVEGNTRPARERHAEAYGLTPAASYAAVLQEIEPGILCDIALPA